MTLLFNQKISHGLIKIPEGGDLLVRKSAAALITGFPQSDKLCSPNHPPLHNRDHSLWMIWMATGGWPMQPGSTVRFVLLLILDADSWIRGYIHRRSVRKSLERVEHKFVLALNLTEMSLLLLLPKEVSLITEPASFSVSWVNVSSSANWRGKIPITHVDWLRNGNYTTCLFLGFMTPFHFTHHWRGEKFANFVPFLSFFLTNYGNYLSEMFNLLQVCFGICFTLLWWDLMLPQYRSTFYFSFHSTFFLFLFGFSWSIHWFSKNLGSLLENFTSSGCKSQGWSDAFVCDHRFCSEPVNSILITHLPVPIATCTEGVVMWFDEKQLSN